MPIPRKFDRRPPERDETRINERIRVPQVRLIGEDGNQIGVVDTQAALRYEPDSESVDAHAPPLDKELKRRLAAIAQLSPGRLLEDKG